MVDSCMGDKRNTQDIICGREKDTTFYSWLTEESLWRVLFMVDSCMGDTKKYTTYNLWWTEERYYVLFKEIHKI